MLLVYLQTRNKIYYDFSVLICNALILVFGVIAMLLAVNTISVTLIYSAFLAFYLFIEY